MSQSILNYKTLSFMGQEVSKAFSANDYSGLWYEFARSRPSIPWESDCDSATAFYSIDNRGNFTLKNTCYNKNQEIAHNIGVIYITNDPLKFRVKFDIGFVGDYWILYTDYNNYSIVSGPDNRYIWILSRRKEVSIRDIEYLKKKLLKFGISPSRLIVNSADKVVI